MKRTWVGTIVVTIDDMDNGTEIDFNRALNQVMNGVSGVDIEYDTENPFIYNIKADITEEI